VLAAVLSILIFIAVALVGFDFLFRRSTRIEVSDTGLTYFTFGRPAAHVALDVISAVETGSYFDAFTDPELRSWHRRNWTHRLLRLQEVRVYTKDGHVCVLTPDDAAQFASDLRLRVGRMVAPSSGGAK
jgi:hypothetical protein